VKGVFLRLSNDDLFFSSMIQQQIIEKRVKIGWLERIIT